LGCNLRIGSKIFIRRFICGVNKEPEGVKGVEGDSCIHREQVGEDEISVIDKDRILLEFDDPGTDVLDGKED
jgi:hypothetical protein